MVSDDYGKTFKNNQTVCQYDQCDGAYRIAYLDEVHSPLQPATTAHIW